MSFFVNNNNNQFLETLYQYDSNFCLKKAKKGKGKEKVNGREKKDFDFVDYANMYFFTLFMELFFYE